MNSNKSIINIETFTCRYIEKEDRLLLSINYKDYKTRVDFWVTRNFLIKLISNFFKFISPSPAKNRHHNEANPNNTTEQTDNTTYQITQKEPVLLESVDLQKRDTAITLTLKNIENSITCKATLAQNEFDNFIQLLIKSSPQYEWGISAFL